MKRPVIYAAPGENLIAGFVFDPRMTCVGKDGKRSGGWRVKWCLGHNIDETIKPSVSRTPGGYLLMQMGVARFLNRGATCNPAELAVEYMRHRSIGYSTEFMVGALSIGFQNNNIVIQTKEELRNGEGHDRT